MQKKKQKRNEYSIRPSLISMLEIRIPLFTRRIHLVLRFLLSPRIVHSESESHIVKCVNP